MDFPGLAPMTLWRKTALAVLVASVIAWSGCGDVFRPVAIPLPGPSPDPKNFHFAIVVSQNAPADRGSGMQIDVSGDTNIGTAQIGQGAVHAALLAPNAGRVYAANNGDDTVSTFTPAPACLFAPCTVTGTGPVTNITLPKGSAPVFVHSTEAGTMYVANSGTSTIAAINTQSNVVTDLIPVGPNPIALAETPDGRKLYSLNQGNGSISSINTVDKSVNPSIVGFTTPIWAVSSLDSSQVFVLDQGTGLISAINTFTDAVSPATVSVAAGASFMFLERHFNRLYVTNPAQNTVTVLDASVSFPNPPRVLATVPTPSVAANPVMVTALNDGTRAYVVSYQCAPVSPCQANSTSISSQVTVIRTSDNTVVGQPVSLGSVDLTTVPAGALTTCSSARFRTSIASSADNSRVYVSNCDAGNTTIISTSTNSLAVPLTSPVSAYTPTSGKQPPPQNPVWVVAEP